MIPDPNRHDLLGENVPTWMLAGGLVLALLLWLGIHRFARRFRDRKSAPAPLVARLAFQALIGTGVLWLGWQVLGRILLLETGWPLWVMALLGAVAVELTVWTYTYERRFVSPGLGRILIALRLGALATLLLILVQPVLRRTVEREINREVVILVDDSESMQLVDQQHTLTDQMAVARLFAPDLVDQRPDLQPLQRRLQTLRNELIQHREGLQAPEAADAAMLENLVRTRGTNLLPFLDELDALLPSAARELEAARQMRGLDSGTRSLLQDLQRRFTDQLPRYSSEARKHVEGGNHLALTTQLKSADDQLTHAFRQLPGAITRIDESFYRNLPGNDRNRLAEATARPRFEIARQLLLQPDGENGMSFIDRLRDRYNVRFIRFGQEVADFDGEPWLEGEAPLTDEADAAHFRRSTNLAAALEDTLAKVPAEALAGVLLLSDGRHNSELPAEDAARQLGAQGSPLCAVAIGSRIGPRDASILRVDSPQSIYLGDRVAVRAEVKLDGLQGKKVRARLMADGQPVAEEIVSVPDFQYRTELRFAHTPPDKGILDYRLVLDPIAGELFDNNNEWDFKCAVTDDRTNVLIIDSFPRWEFRYLRNLFYGRDKSVHLQYVLLNPDGISNAGRRPEVAASAARDFGDAEATQLPQNASEWRKFDALILGDIPPAAIDNETWRTIRQCVSERGSMLVFVAGPRYFPHTHTNRILRELLPIEHEPDRARFSGPEESFRFELTSPGMNSPILQQSLSRTLNRQIWGGIPPLPWRYIPPGVKDGAEVLAYAAPAEGNGPENDPGFSGNPGDVEAALERLANRKALEEENALLVTQRFGMGRVVLLNFDSTWRFRYGTGDTYHHKFWGQMMRWGTGENLRSGGEYVRLGTDQLSYSPNAPIQVTAKVLDRDLQPITGGAIHVSLYRGDKRLQRRQLAYREGSNGMFDASLDPIAVEGDYRLVLEGSPVRRAMKESGLSEVETPIIITKSKSSIEFAELTADYDYLAQTAQLASGTVASINETHALIDFFGAAKEILEERRDVKLWDKWPLLVMFLGLVGSEWVLRRRGGLT